MRTRLPIVVLAAFASLIALPLRPAQAMSFRAVQFGNAGAVISATGQIDESTPNDFISFLQEYPGTRNFRPVVVLDSPGGRVLASMQFGTLLRRIGATATVMNNGQCFSACVYALMGGRRRVIPASSQVGIHRMFAYEQEYDANSGEAYVRRRYDNGAMGSVLKRYTSQMGVSPALISEAEHIPSDGLKILSRNEIRRYHLGVSSF